MADLTPPGRRPPGLRLHERTMKVQRASGDVHQWLSEFWEASDLTATEMAVICAEMTQNYLKYALRGERHPEDPTRKADEE